ncbi:MULTISPECIES: hypothetical protein [Kitasatospora]|uniref:Secreted protein n=1 Tax=Kitasatospora setae (strain ATCC 33774 / DSM 43861 / JCM 3304 / KCC A-0304 / NBRC 14216 / KM-6054) TaxID=452652 RepID=E4NEW8_KITSK|nr:MULTISPECIES: hypothetical protein [Kitasatospora]BAJ29904.1 hypothetical protein KSE_41160 [Kitasatospora setae KM-6054]
MTRRRGAATTPAVPAVPIVLAALAALLLTGTPPATAADAPPPTAADARSAPGWTVDAFPAGNAALQDVGRGGGRSAWAVGRREIGLERGRISYQPVAFVRDEPGAAWRQVELPAGLEASTVAPDGAGGTWVTGSRQGDSVPLGRYRAGRWQLQEVPLPAHVTGGGLTALASAGGPRDEWAVGYYQPDDLLTFHGLIEHGDGTSWQPVPVPDLGTDYWTLTDVAAAGPSDVWAAGSVGTADGWTNPLLLHYDGRAWSKVAAPDLDARYGDLVRLVVAGPGDVWAVGTETGPTRQDRTLVAHFDGRAWTVQPTGLGDGKATGAARTPDGVAVVGYRRTGGGYQPIGARLTRHGWEPLGLPAGPGPEGRIPGGVLSAGEHLTVVGVAPTGRAPDGAPLPPLPFSLTR